MSTHVRSLIRPRLFSLWMIASMLIQAILPAPVQAAPLDGSGQATAPSDPFVDCSLVTEIPQTECEALVDVYNLTGGSTWNNQTGWLDTDTPCAWHGVACDGGFVTMLSLGSNNLVNGLPDSLIDLPHLVTLNLSGNSLTGGIPAALGQLTSLQYLHLDNNELSGAFPGELGNLANLRELYLHINALSGNLPSGIGGLTSLRIFYMNENDIDGTFPASIVNLTQLTDFKFDCELTSSEPAVIAFIDTIVPGWQNEICLPPGSVVSLSGNAGAAGVSLSYYDNGSLQTFTADGDGNYSFEVAYGWNGQVIPSLDGYYFTPGCRTYEQVTGHRIQQNYIALPNPPIADSAGNTSRASLDDAEVQGNCSSSWSSLSSNGRYVAFISDSTTLVAGDTNGFPDVFVRDLQSGLTTRVSVHSSGAQGNGISGAPFDPSYSSGPSISGDGRYVAFNSTAGNLVDGDSNAASDIFVHDRLNGTTVLVSLDSSGGQGNDHSFQPAISADGRYVAFNSLANNLVENDTNAALDVFVRDLQAGTTVRVSVDSNGAQANNSVDSWKPAISGDGRFVAFSSDASNLVDGDANSSGDIFVRDLLGSTTVLVSKSSAGVQTNSFSYRPSISADGRYVAFASLATNLVSLPVNNTNAYVHDLSTGETELVSADLNGDFGVGPSVPFSISADGRYVAFDSFSGALVPLDENGKQDVFIRDLQTGHTLRISVDSNSGEANGESFWGAISADARLVSFTSLATDLVAGDTNGARDIFVVNHAALSDPPAIFSKTSPGDLANDQSTAPTLEWEASFGAANYEYCYDTSDDDACTTWTDNQNATSVNLTNLIPGSTYYWHVRANSIGGTTYSNNAETAFWAFTIPCYSLQFNSSPPWGGSVSADPAPNCNGTLYSHGTLVTMTGLPNAGYGFASWSGDVISTDNPVQVTMTAPTFLNANFTQTCFSLFVAVDPVTGGSVETSPSPNCPGDPGKYSTGTTVTLTAVPAAGYSFSAWSGDVSGAANPVDLDMTADRFVTVTFAETCYSLTTTASPLAGGTIGVNPAPNCESDPAKYHAGTVVTLTANASPGYAFTSWSGDASGGVSPFDVTLDADKSVTANFAEACFTLTTQGNPIAGGSVGVSPAPNCPGDPARYAAGTPVTLTAAPNPGYIFNSWSGDASGTDNPSTVIMSADRSATANFDLACYTLTTNANPLAGGSVGVSPAPNCNNSTQYTHGTILTLTATPNTGYLFSAWSGDVIDTENPTTLTMTANKSVTAEFSLACFTLTTSANPVAGGSVGVSPAPNCNGGTQYSQGTVVTLTATANSGYNFASWSGSASGTLNPTTVSMTADRSVTANFTALCYTLTKSASPAAGGSVGASPAPNCNGGTQYTHGTLVTLTAIPNSGYSFTVWSGSASGTANPTTVSITANRSVTATFGQACFTLTASANPAAGGSVGVSPAPNCNGGTQYSQGTLVTLTATARAGYNFASWSGNASGTANPTTVTMTASKTVTANFAEIGAVMVASITRLDANPIAKTRIKYAVTFTRHVKGVDVDDFALTTYGLTRANILSVYVSDGVYTVTVSTGEGNGALRLDLVDNDTILDSDDRPLGGTGLGNGDYRNGESYFVSKGARFVDVPTEHWAWAYIESLYNAGVTGGCYAEPPYFCPNNNVTRAQMAVFLLSAKHGPTYVPPAATGAAFPDVPKTYWAAAWIEQLAREGATGGCGDGNYCPDAVVTRDQMAVFLLRTKYGSGYTPPAATGMFKDVPKTYWAAAWIEQLAREGITGGCGGGNYCPKGVVNRAQMSVFLMAAFDLPMLWELPEE
ncbi:MAG: S-layer homology domain-containing protein [Chloroflexi bacterium]|nr:S-layer homology domain-containing protein [Chloroflexota bacterium]